MGRELCRVPLDFDHPLWEIWPGNLPPDGLTAEEIDEWEPEGPPEGEGWQVWENTTEGSPCSPVFPSSDELFEWLINRQHEAWPAPFGDTQMSRRAAANFIDRHELDADKKHERSNQERKRISASGSDAKTTTGLSAAGLEFLKQRLKAQHVESLWVQSVAIDEALRTIDKA